MNNTDSNQRLGSPIAGKMNGHKRMFQHPHAPLPHNYLEIAMGKRIVVVPGEKYNQLTFLSEAAPRVSNGYKSRRANVVCDCGTSKEMDLIRFSKGSTLSCGCAIKGAPRNGKIHKSVQLKIGDSYSNWTVMEDSIIDLNVECKCACGTTKKVNRHAMIYGRSKSCGCLSRVPGGAFGRGHNSWRAMKERCENKNSPNYPPYGGRGIKVCDRWRESYTDFIEDMGVPKKGWSIERKDVNGNYEPENCKWATHLEQCSNKRTSVIYIIDGVEYLGLAAASLGTGLKIKAIQQRCRGYISKGKRLPPKPGYGSRSLYPKTNISEMPVKKPTETTR